MHTEYIYTLLVLSAIRNRHPDRLRLYGESSYPICRVLSPSCYYSRPSVKDTTGFLLKKMSLSRVSALKVDTPPHAVHSASHHKSCPLARYDCITKNNAPFSLRLGACAFSSSAAEAPARPRRPKRSSPEGAAAASRTAVSAFGGLPGGRTPVPVG